MKKAIVLMSMGFWFFIYSHPGAGHKVNMSRSADSKGSCEADAGAMYAAGWDVSNCRDSDNLEAGND